MAAKSKKAARAQKAAKAVRAVRAPAFGANKKAAPSIGRLRMAVKKDDATAGGEG